MIYFIILLSASGSQFWRVANDSRLAQIYLMENMFILSFVFFISIIQLRQVLIIYTADLIIWITVISGCGDSLTVKSYSYALEMLFYLSLFTLKCH